jgi:uncharacterized protein YcnI
MNRTITLAVTLLTLGFAGTAVAHISLETGEAPANSTYKAVLRVPHGCDGAATTAVRVQIPEGVIVAKPMPKAGWTLETATGAYAKSYDYYGETLTEGVKEIAWSGGTLPDAWYDEFVFRARLPDAPAGTVIYFPVVQECGDAAERWIEVPAEGQDPDSLPLPAPALTLTEAVAGH